MLEGKVRARGLAYDFDHFEGPWMSLGWFIVRNCYGRGGCGVLVEG